MYLKVRVESKKSQIPSGRLEISTARVTPSSCVAPGTTRLVGSGNLKKFGSVLSWTVKWKPTFCTLRVSCHSGQWMSCYNHIGIDQPDSSCHGWTLGCCSCLHPGCSPGCSNRRRSSDRFHQTGFQRTCLKLREMFFCIICFSSLCIWFVFSLIGWGSLSFLPATCTTAARGEEEPFHSRWLNINMVDI